MPSWLPVFCIAVMLAQLRIVDLYNIARVCKKRVKHLTLVLSIAALTAFHVGAMLTVYLLTDSMELFTVFYAFLGFVLVIPLRFLFSDSIIRIVSVLFTTKGFTLSLLALAILTGRFFSEELRAVAELSALTALLIVVTPWYSYFCKAVFKMNEKKLSESLSKRLLLLSAVWFFSILFTYLSFTANRYIFSILSLIGMGALAFLCYRFIYSSAKTSQKNTKLSEIVFIDDLTGLENRTAFFKDGQALINNGKHFDVVFLDLNRFKLINDRYGHLKGNDYLIGFSHALKAIVKERGRAYRLSGDEFVLLVKGGEANGIIAQLCVFSWHSFVKSIEFLGVSAGCASYPPDGATLDELVFVADKAMYEHKREGTKIAVS